MSTAREEGHTAFQLEPDALIEAFRAHPPEGFEVLAGRPLLFAAPFDLLTTADPALKRRLARLPLYRLWSRLLRLRTAFFGATVSEYLPWPRADRAQAQLRRALSDWAPRYPLLIVKDLPLGSPLLGARDNALAEALAQACVQAGCILVEGQALAYVPIDFDSIDAYLQRLSAGRRKDLKRKLRQRARLEVRRRRCGDAAFADEAAVDAYYALYEAVYAQSELHFDRLTRDFFATVLRDAVAGGIVFEYWLDSALVGWNLCFEHDGRLVDKYIGLRYPQARDCNLYFVSWMVNLEYALERGLTAYVAGWSDPGVKAQLGARFTFTRHAVHVRNPLLRALARRFAGHFESDRIWQAEREGDLA